MGRIILYIMENKKCLKPPTSHGFLPDWMGTQWMFIFLMGIQWISLWDFREIWTISVKKNVEHRFKERNFPNNSRNTCHLPHVENYICFFPYISPCLAGSTIVSWLVVDLPLWKIWVRQLGWWFPTEWKNNTSSNHQPVSFLSQKTMVMTCSDLP